MRHRPKALTRQRGLLDVRLEKARKGLDALAMPRGGWIRAIRESLGMSAAELGKRMGVTASVVLRLERSEQKRTISLGSLERAARALGCELLWVLRPPESLEAEVMRRARAVAARRMGRAAHSMALEDQQAGTEHTTEQVAAWAAQLREKLGPGLWSDG
jgi:predicted DNA-binding mobile mystery protein A